MPAASNVSSAADVADKEGGHAKTAAERANSEAAKLLKIFNAAKPAAPDNYMPSFGMPGGGDIHLQPGLFTGALIGPGVWPTESESELAQAKTKLQKLSERHEEAASEARRRADEVFSEHWTDGDGKDAAYEHYSAEHRAHTAVVDVIDGVADTQGRLSEHIRLAKRNIRDAHDAAHREIEQYLNAPGGVPTAQIAVITTKYRTQIEEHSGQLRAWVADETTLLTNKFGIPEAPPGSPGNQDKPADGDRNTGESSGDPTTNPVHPTTNHGDAPGRSTGQPDGPGAATDPTQGLPTPVGPLRATGEPSAGANGTPKPPSMPSMPSMPSPPSMGSGGGSGGGASSPLSSLGSGMGGMQGMSSGAQGVGGLSSPASGVQGPAAGGASPASLGSEFGRGMAAGNAAAGGMPPLASSAPPQAPSGPLSAAPLGQASAPASAAPTASTVPASATPAGPASAGGGGMGGIPAGGLGATGGSAGPSPQMTSYGSLLPPSAPTAAAGAAGAPASAPSAPAAAAAGGSAAAGAPGFLPGIREVNSGQRVGRDVSMTDLESARAVVADLAAASSVVYPGLEWAVAVSRGASGLPEMWVTTNEGAGYIPSEVHIPRSMPLAAHFDPDFDARWFGWFNPAETVLRAVRMRGDALSAIATTWAQDSDEVRSATPDVAIGVAPSGDPGEAEASTLTRGRSHRLETISPAVFAGLLRDPDEAERYARQLTQQVVFSGPEMSAAAMSVARAVIAGQWPSEREWADLAAQYETDRLMAGSQRPGLMGVEEPHQLAAYQHDFVQCRRLETLLCWQGGDHADVVYAAITAGVNAPVLA